MTATSLRVAMYTEGLPFSGDTLEHQALGGSETAFIHVARELARAGHSVDAYCHCTREAEIDGVTYRDVRQVTRLQDEQFDLFICSRFFGVFTQQIRSRIKVLWMHDVLAPELVDSLRSVQHEVDAIFCLSQYHGELTLSVIPEIEPKLELTVNGLDFDSIHDARSAVASKHHQIMFTSRPERGLVRALTIYERLGDKELDLLICSYESIGDAPTQREEQSCVAKIAELQRRGFPIRTGSLPQRELHVQLARSKAVLYPTDYPEVFCISAAEAQACGTVVVASDDFALRETMAYPGVPRDSDDAFVSRLGQVLRDPGLRSELQQRGEAHVRSFTWKSVAERFAGVSPFAEQSAPPLMPNPVPYYDAIGARVEQSRDAWPGRDASGRSQVMQLPDVQQRELQRRGTRPATSLGIANVSRGPMISCLTVTRGRLRLLKRAIVSYCRQTYPDRELVILSESEGRYVEAIQEFVRGLARDDIRVVAVDGDPTLGAIRNLSLEAARGDVVCQWDDDDLYHPQRLEVQVGTLLRGGGAACLMTDQLHLLADRDELHWVDWTVDDRMQGVWRLIPGSIMRFADDRFRYPEEGERATKGEDSSLLEDLMSREPIVELRGHGHLYLYTFHGSNTFPEEHHVGQLSRSASPEFLRDRMRTLQEAISHYPVRRPLRFYVGDKPVATFS